MPPYREDIAYNDSEYELKRKENENNRLEQVHKYSPITMGKQRRAKRKKAQNHRRRTR